MKKVTLTKVTKTKNEKFQIELSDGSIIRPNSTSSLLQELNEGDSDFEQESRRLAWAKVTPEGLAKIKGVTAEHISQMKALVEVGDSVELNIANPTLKGKELRVLINDSLVPDEYQRENWQKSAKQLTITQKLLESKTPHTPACEHAIDEAGYFVDQETGNLIFSRTSIVPVNPDTEPEHNIIRGTIHTLAEVEAALTVSSDSESVSPSTEI